MSDLGSGSGFGHNRDECCLLSSAPTGFLSSDLLGLESGGKDDLEDGRSLMILVLLSKWTSLRDDMDVTIPPSEYPAQYELWHWTVPQ